MIIYDYLHFFGNFHEKILELYTLDIFVGSLNSLGDVRFLPGAMPRLHDMREPYRDRDPHRQEQKIKDSSTKRASECVAVRKMECFQIVSSDLP